MTWPDAYGVSDFYPHHPAAFVRLQRAAAGPTHTCQTKPTGLFAHKSFLAKPAPNVEDVTLGPNQEAINVEHLFPLEHLVFQLK